MSTRIEPFHSRRLFPLLVVLLIVGVVYLALQMRKEPPRAAPAAGPGEYLLCTWNVENLFDDQDDRRNRTDDEYDNWFAHNAADRELKYRRLAEALLRMNGGKGPDIVVAVEVESRRAADMLAEVLNKALPEGAGPYSTVVMEEISAGRHIAPAVISRVPLSTAHRPRVLSPQRILIVNLSAGGHELIVFATHWTSHRSDDEGAKREKYADLVYGRANEIYHADPKADVVVCGDFNDAPEAPAVRDNLHTGSADEVRSARELRFLNLMADKDSAKFGTHYYGKPVIYDHICVSPGLLDNEGWSCDVDSVTTFTDGLIKSGSRLRRPWRFGNARDAVERGYSDHFPVLVKMRVAGNENSR